MVSNVCLGKKRLTLFEQPSHPKSLVTRRINHPNDKCILAANLLMMNIVSGKLYTLCNQMVINILIHKSYLNHNGHRFIPPAFSFPKMHSIPDESLELMERSSCIGLKAATVRDLLQVMDGSDKRFQTATINNILHKFEVLANNKLGITNDMSATEKAINYLSR